MCRTTVANKCHANGQRTWAREVEELRSEINIDFSIWLGSGNGNHWQVRPSDPKSNRDLVTGIGPVLSGGPDRPVFLGFHNSSTSASGESRLKLSSLLVTPRQVSQSLVLLVSSPIP